MLSRVRAVRRHLAQQLGFVVPALQVSDNVKLRPQEYVVSIRGVEVARFELEADHLLAINHAALPIPIAGRDTRDPAFGSPAKWIELGAAEQALANGYAVVDHASVLVTHLSEVFRMNAHELLSRNEVKRLLDSLNESHPKLVEELVPRHLSLGEVQRILQNVLREQVPIRDLPTILETLAELSPINKNTVFLVEAVRQNLARTLVKPLLHDEQELAAFSLPKHLEEQIVRATDVKTGHVDWNPGMLTGVVSSLRKIFGSNLESASAVLLCPSPARFHLKRLLEPFAPRMAVLSPLELPTSIQVRRAGILE